MVEKNTPQPQVQPPQAQPNAPPSAAAALPAQPRILGVNVDPPPPPGVFDEVRKLEQATTAGSSGQRHTFGAWVRAKGVKLKQVQAAIEAKRISGDLVGDGPEMTEEEFDHAVDFRLANTFGELPVHKIHIPAEQARGGAPPTREELDAQDDAAALAASKGRKV